MYEGLIKVIPIVKGLLVARYAAARCPAGALGGELAEWLTTFGDVQAGCRDSSLVVRIARR